MEASASTGPDFPLEDDPTQQTIPHLLSLGTAKKLARRSRSDEVRERVCRLARQLDEAHQANTSKDEELAHTRALLSKLESAIEQQAKDSQFEQDRTSSLEATLSHREQGTEEKVVKLLLAVASEKRRADAAQAALQDLAKQAAASYENILSGVQDKLAAEESLRHTAEQKVSELQEKLGSMEATAAARQSITLVSGDEHEKGTEREQQSSAQPPAQLADDQGTAEREPQRASLRQLLSEVQSEKPGTLGGNELQQIKQLRQQLTDETLKCANFELQLLGRDQKLDQLQQELMVELIKRKTLQQQVIDKERAICDLQQKLIERQAKCEVLKTPRPGNENSDAAQEKSGGVDAGRPASNRQGSVSVCSMPGTPLRHSCSSLPATPSLSTRISLPATPSLSTRVSLPATLGLSTRNPRRSLDSNPRRSLAMGRSSLGAGRCASSGSFSPMPVPAPPRKVILTTENRRTTHAMPAQSGSPPCGGCNALPSSPVQITMLDHGQRQPIRPCPRMRATSSALVSPR